MFDIFSTREVATAIYLILFIAYAFTKKGVTKSFVNVIKALMHKVFIIPVLCFFIYASLIVFVLQFSPFWDWVLIKDVIIWVLFIATPICFKAATKKIGDYPFHKMVIDNFIGSAIIEFIINEFTFSFCVEMLLVPTLSFLVLLQSISSSDSQYKKVQKILNGILGIAGFTIIIFSIAVAVRRINQNGITDVIDILVSFSIPIIFSIAFLPIVYLLALIGQYHDLFIRIKIRNKDEEVDLKKKKIEVIKACGLSFKKVQSFSNSYIHNYITSICSANDDNTFLDFIEQFKKDTELR